MIQIEWGLRMHFYPEECIFKHKEPCTFTRKKASSNTMSPSLNDLHTLQDNYQVTKHPSEELGWIGQIENNSMPLAWWLLICKKINNRTKQRIWVGNHKQDNSRIGKVETVEFERSVSAILIEAAFLQDKCYTCFAVWNQVWGNEETIKM